MNKLSFEDKVPCDQCGIKGSFDFNGDKLCEACIKEIIKENSSDDTTSRD